MGMMIKGREGKGREKMREGEGLADKREEGW